MRRIAIFALFLAIYAILATPAYGTDFAGPAVVIPVAGRAAGAFGSQWQTDLVVTNARRQGPAVTVTILFSRSGGEKQIVTANLQPRGTLVLKDVIHDVFGHASAVGMLRIGTTSPEAKITARARIYNIGTSVGEFGQIVHGMPLTKLAREAYLPGLTGTDGNRTNAGIANPGEKDATVWLHLFDEAGEFRGGFTTVVPAGTVRQFNDVFNEFQAGPLDGATLQIGASEGVYAYASIVHGDSGDADFITATGVDIDDSDAVITPACAAPAPLQLAPTPAAGWIVIYHAGTNAIMKTAELAEAYDFAPRHVYEHGFQGFFAELTQTTIAALRCNDSVQMIEQNVAVPLP